MRWLTTPTSSISPSHSCEGDRGLDRCALLRKYQFRETFIKTSRPFLVVILRDIAGQRSRVKSSSTWSPCTMQLCPRVLEQARLCSPTKQVAVTNSKWNIAGDIRHECWRLCCTPDIKGQIERSALAKEVKGWWPSPSAFPSWASWRSLWIKRTFSLINLSLPSCIFLHIMTKLSGLSSTSSSTGVAEVGPRPGEGLVEWTGVP